MGMYGTHLDADRVLVEVRDHARAPRPERVLAHDHDHLVAGLRSW